ncbi:sulfatase [Halomicroarcula sp. GCM10025817]|uniref:sulfatase n=2 Tax=Haloarcula TaxID=2237 RepID=UPI00360CFF05
MATGTQKLLPRKRTTHVAMERPNIVWITLDSVRADHTTLDGYDRETTPELERIGRDGHAFRNCIAHSLSTLPSTGAMMSGYPPSHNTVGVDGNRLPDSITTMPERFADAGYATACLSRNSYLSSATGLDKGFDRFQWLSSSTLHEAGIGPLLSYALNLRTHSAGLSRDTAKHSSAYLMNEVAKDWLADFRRNDDPFFFYLHYNEPHRPYYPPRKYLERFTDDISMSGTEAAEFALDVHYNLEDVVANGCELTDDEWAALEAMYDAEIAYTDEMVGRLFDYIQSHGDRDTVVVITADHGELFGEYGLLSHSYVLHDAVTRVPLVVQGLDEDLAVDGDDTVQHLDVFRTLLNVAGGDPGDTIGVDLREETRDFAVSQRGPTDFDELLAHNPSFDTSRFHTETLTALRTPEFKYQRSSEKAELFALPDEDEDVSGDYPEERAALEEELGDWLDKYGQPVGDAEEGEFSDAVTRQLRDLGYME